MKFLGNNITTLADITSVIAGTGLSGGGTSGDVTLNVETELAHVTTMAGLASFGAAGATTSILAGDVTMYNNVNDGNPTISLGSAAGNRFEIKTAYNSGAQTLDSVSFTSYTTSSTTNDGRYFFNVDEVQLMALLDAGTTVYGNITAAADGAAITSQNSTASSATEGGKLTLRCDDGAAMADNHRLGVVEFSGAEDASNNRQTGASIQAMCDAAWSASENGTRLEFYTMDGNAASELSLTLDSDLLATFAGAVTVTGALTGTLATVSQPNITGVGTIDTGVWNGTAIASANLDADTAHLSGSQTFTGTKTLNSFKGTAGATVTNINDTDAFSDASATTLATSESIKAYADTKVASAAQKQFTYHMMVDDIDTTKIYVGLQEADAESATSTNKNLPFLAPVAGKLLKIFIRGTTDLSGNTLTWRLETQAAGLNTAASPTVVGTQSGAGCTNQTMATYDFTSSLDSGDNIIDAGDAVQISVQSDGATANTKFFITCQWEWDLS